MADNTPQNGTASIAADDIGSGLLVQRIKVGSGVDGSYADATATAGLPVSPTQSATGTITNPSSGMAGTASFTVLASNTSRKGAVFMNDTNVDLLLALASAASATSYTVRLKVGGYYELPGQDMVYTGIVTGLPVATGSLTATAASSGSLLVTELT